MAAKAGGQLLVDLLHLLAVDGGGVAVVVALAEEDAPAVRAHAQHLRVLARQPRGTRAGGRSQIDAHAGGIEIVDDFAHPVKVVLPLLGLKRGPREDAQRDDVHVRLLHQLDVFGENVRAVEPLVGVVVRAIAQNGGGHGARSFLSQAALGSLPSLRYTVKYMVVKHARPPRRLETGSARNTPAAPSPRRGSSSVSGTTMIALRSREKNTA